ncbi:MAG: UDP-N-acetylmuramate--L-alanine ligase [Proteobacteria bacterium]|nr:MAG: UDP-N-acetylmuramate--L-alanine ligase [Pseudomonadota bacterium]
MYNTKLHFHFTGIGGSGMSGLAEILLNLGFRVSGSDLKVNAACRRLQNLGAVVHAGHTTSNLPQEASLLVYSSAVDPANPEVIEAKERRIPVIRRAEVLAELMRLKFGVCVAGSHGKTTTTSMLASVMQAAALDPTVIIGGQAKALQSGGRLGRGEFLVAESDESDRSFLMLKPTIAVITNIDNEHVGAYAGFSELEESFEKFLQAVPFYGLAILCIDDPRVRELAQRFQGRQITYGFSPDARVAAKISDLNSGISKYEIFIDGESRGQVELHMPGRHMVQNSLAAFALALELDIPLDTVKEALQSFAGVERRSEVLLNTENLMIINDYAHHPTEIKATITAIKESWHDRAGRIVVVFQPHRYSRTRDCFAEFITAFQECDLLVTTDIYPASEAALEGISGELLHEAIAHTKKLYVKEIEELPQRVRSLLQSRDVVLCLGAGSIGALAHQLAEECGNC